MQFIIEGKRWFDKINGNTYHNVLIFDIKKNKHIFESGITYGYDEAFKQTAFEWLIENKLWKQENRFNRDLVRKHIYFTVCDVSRKKDL